MSPAAPARRRMLRSFGTLAAMLAAPAAFAQPQPQPSSQRRALVVGHLLDPHG